MSGALFERRFRRRSGAWIHHARVSWAVSPMRKLNHLSFSQHYMHMRKTEPRNWEETTTKVPTSRTLWWSLQILDLHCLIYMKLLVVKEYAEMKSLAKMLIWKGVERKPKRTSEYLGMRRGKHGVEFSLSQNLKIGHPPVKLKWKL